MLHGPKQTQMLAKQLRRQMSLPEAMLWRELRKRPAGLKFRRQHPAEHHVLGFFCAEKCVAIEIDGEAHERADRPEKDAARDQWLISRGIGIIRLPASVVLNDVEAVVIHIVRVACGDYPSTAFGGPPPPPGED